MTKIVRIEFLVLLIIISMQLFQKSWANDFYTSIQQENVALFSELITKTPSLLKKRNKYNETAIHLAALYGQIDILRFIIKKCPDCLYDTGNSNHNIAYYAVQNGHLEMLKYLLVLDINLLHGDGDNPFKETPVHAAAVQGDINIIKCMLKIDPSVFKSRYSTFINKIRYESPINLVMQNGHLATFKFIVSQYPASLYENDNYNGNAPIHAVLGQSLNKKRFDILKFIAEHDPKSLERKNIHGITPAMLAARWSHLNELNFIIKNYLNALLDRDFYGRTAVMFAAISGNLNTIVFILNKYPNAFNDYDIDGWDVLDYLVKYNRKKAFFFIIRNYKDIKNNKLVEYFTNAEIQCEDCSVIQKVLQDMTNMNYIQLKQQYYPCFQYEPSTCKRDLIEVIRNHVVPDKPMFLTWNDIQKNINEPISLQILRLYLQQIV